MYSIYEAKKFDLPKLEGISEKSVEEHLGLYQGYVKNFNAISSALEEFVKDSEKNAQALSELTRRRSFEFGGMRLHELYFAQWEGGAKEPDMGGALAKALEKDSASIELAIKQIKSVGLMRGPGWSILYFDPEAQKFLIGFSGEQHQGHFVTLPVILALDVWEHAFLLDYGAQGKGKYIDAFFKNLNWGVIEKRFAKVQK
jgi:Fe-Mn family superoxide dismutase